VVTAGLDNTIGVWGLEKQGELRVLNNHVDVVNQIAARPADPENTRSLIVSVSDDATVRFWQPEIGRMVRFARLESIPTCVVWNQAGTRAIVGTRSGQIHFVDPATANVVKTMHATGWINCLALSPDEKSVWIGGESGLDRVSISSK
jgi:WD40 repeat protein